MNCTTLRRLYLVRQYDPDASSTTGTLVCCRLIYNEQLIIQAYQQDVDCKSRGVDVVRKGSLVRLRQRGRAYPELSGRRLLRELRAIGYPGGYTIVADYLRKGRPPPVTGFEHRFEMPPSAQAQIDFSHFKLVFSDEPTQLRIVRLFSLVLGQSRNPFARFVLRQTVEEVVRCHLAAFAALGGLSGGVRV